MNPRPVRLRRSRAKGARLVSPNGLPIVCVTRPGRWGNPIRVGVNVPDVGDEFVVTTAAEAVKCYRLWLSLAADGQVVEEAARRELRGKNLACYCALDKPCHADVLLEIANAPLAGEPEAR